MEKHKIKIYSTPTCAWCNIAKQFFKEHKIEFEEIDVSQDTLAAQEMVKKSGQIGVPVIEIDNKIIIGFNEQKIRDSLNI